MLSNRQQVARIRYLAVRALDAYPWRIRSYGLLLMGKTPRSGSMRQPPVAVIVFCSVYTARLVMADALIRRQLCRCVL